ncbi:MAG: hypothetical protein IIC01_12725 [Planctomycetes bacterium]|nr:hypothetical protein [Planctomycetota bacterium]
MVFVIMATLVSMAAPRFSNSIALQRVEAAARRIVVDLALAQRQARSSNASQTVRFTTGTHEYSLVGMSHPDHLGLEYKVLLSEDPYGASIVSANFGGDAELIFDVFGVPDSGGSVVIQVGNHVRTVTVDPVTGRATTP